MQTGYAGLLELYNYELVKRDYIDEQVMELKGHCKNIIIEKNMSYRGAMEIDKLISRLTKNSTLIICSLKFLAANKESLYERMKAIEDNEINLKVLDMKENTLSTHFKAFMEFNTYISGMRVKKGAYQAKHFKAYKPGRRRTISDDIRKEIIIKRNTKIVGVKKPTANELALEYKCSRQTIYNILRGN